MAELLTNDELDLDEDERERRKGESVGTPLPEENMRLIRMAGGMSGAGPRAEIPTASSKLPDTLTPPQPESIGTPIQGMLPANAPRPAYERYQSLSAEKRKPWSDLGFGGRVGRVAESIGTAINPNIVAAIPGTAPHHQREVGQARTAAQQENAEITGQSEEELRNAQAEEQRALAEKNRRPEAAGKTPEETTIHDLMTGNNGQPRVNPKTQQPYTYMDAYTDVMEAKAGAKPDRAQSEVVKRKVGKENHNILVDKATGKDIADLGIVGEKEPTEPGNYQPVTDARGNTVGWVDPKSRHFVPTTGIHGVSEAAGVKPGEALPQKPTTQMRNVGAQAQVAADGIPDVIAEVGRLKDKLGPISGRWNDFMQGKVGLDDPDFAGLRADLLMLSSAVALAHARGRLPENLREEFDRAINAPKQTADNIVAVLNHIQPWMKRMTDIGVDQGHGGTGQHAKGDQRTNKKTGEVQEFDGTQWQTVKQPK